MKYFILYMISCFLIGYFFWNRKPRWRYPILLALGLGFSFVVLVLHKY